MMAYLLQEAFDVSVICIGALSPHTHTHTHTESLPDRLRLLSVAQSGITKQTSTNGSVKYIK